MPTTKKTQQDKEAYVTGPGSYNRESGRKTLVFVGILITFITMLTILSLVLLTHK